MEETEEHYLRHVAECLELAQRAQDPQDRVRLLEMAQAWRELATKIHRPDASEKS
jgi:hypothetical protein